MPELKGKETASEGRLGTFIHSIEDEGLARMETCRVCSRGL